MPKRKKYFYEEIDFEKRENPYKFKFIKDLSKEFSPLGQEVDGALKKFPLSKKAMVFLGLLMAVYHFIDPALTILSFEPLKIIFGWLALDIRFLFGLWLVGFVSVFIALILINRIFGPVIESLYLKGNKFVARAYMMATHFIMGWFFSYAGVQIIWGFLFWLILIGFVLFFPQYYFADGEFVCLATPGILHCAYYNLICYFLAASYPLILNYLETKK